MNTYRLRKDDVVQVLAGKDKGKTGKILKLDKKHAKVLVEKVNIVKRHTKANPYAQEQGGIKDKEMPLDISNVALMCPSCAKASRVGYRFTEDGKKVRFCKKCDEII